MAHHGVFVGTAQRVHGAFQFGVDVPRVVLVEFVLHFGLARQQFVEIGVGFGKGGVYLLKFAE